MRFSAGASKPSLVLGEQFVPGSDSEHFFKPTDVAILSTGEFFISDGSVHCLNDVMLPLVKNIYLNGYTSKNTKKR